MFLHQCARALGMCCYVSAVEDGEVRTTFCLFCPIHHQHCDITFTLPVDMVALLFFTCGITNLL